MSTKTKNKLPTFTINRRLWHRGLRKHTSALLVPKTGRMCCLGQIALQCGYTKEQIKGHCYPCDLEDVAKVEKVGLIINSRSNSELAARMAAVNDTHAINDKEREIKLKELASGHFDLVFVK